jgi:hypothetical protein
LKKLPFLAGKCNYARSPVMFGGQMLKKIQTNPFYEIDYLSLKNPKRTRVLDKHAFFSGLSQARSLKKTCLFKAA